MKQQELVPVRVLPLQMKQQELVLVKLEVHQACGKGIPSHNLKQVTKPKAECLTDMLHDPCNPRSEIWSSMPLYGETTNKPSTCH